MLDHAAKFRVEKLSRYGGEVPTADEPEGFDLDLPGVGARRYVGDRHVWAWYRGTSVGPYACMSALLALEQFIDHLHDKLNFPARKIVDLLMQDCHNLAVPGLLVGFLTRHPDSTGDLLDPFLALPNIWHLETARVPSEFVGIRVRDPDADKLTGAETRRHTPHETVSAMVINARLRGDEERLAELERVGKQLVESV